MIKTIIKGNIVELMDGTTGTIKRIIPKQIQITTKKTPPKLLLIKKPKEEELYKGETNTIEYKESAMWSQNLTQQELQEQQSPETKKYGQKTSKIIIAKTIAAFLNTNGGKLIIGIKENKQNNNIEITGIEQEIKKLKNKDYNNDGYKRMITDDIIKPYFPKNILNHFNEHININFIEKEGKTLCLIKVRPNNEETFITINNKDHYYIKIDTETRELQGKQIIDHIKKRFG
jgi:predicted HTH transcriptional regulator